jgi:hypothetical protein
VEAAVIAVQSTPLPERSVRRHLESAQEYLSPMQRSRLAAIVALLDQDGYARLDRVLDVATPGGDDATRQATFRKFKDAVNDALVAAGVNLSFTVDRRKVAPARRLCWFNGSDTVRAELAEISDEETDDVRTRAIVSAQVGEMLQPARVYVSCATGSTASEQLYRDFVGRLRQRSAASRRPLEVELALDVPLGGRKGNWRAERMAGADVIVELVDVAYLQPGEASRASVAAAGKPRLAVNLGEVGRDAEWGDIDPGGLIGQRRSYADTPRSSWDGYVDDVRAALARLPGVEQPWVERPFGEAHERKDDLDRRLQRLGEHASSVPADHELVEQNLYETTWQHIEAESGRPLGDPTPAVDRLIDWAIDNRPTALRHCALLGDSGMGKTTTAKLLARRLLARLGSKEFTPLPVYFDLRRLPVGDTTGGYRAGGSLTVIIEQLLNATDESVSRPSAREVLDRVEAGGCVVIFDGLDEVLVHLAPADRPRFTNTLWRGLGRGAFDHGSTADGSQGGLPPSKMLLTCRTHLFGTMAEEATHFAGQDREGPTRRDYLTLLMLPFSEEQIREYFRCNLPDQEPDALLALIAGVHNLRELAERPYTLSLIAESLHQIEEIKLGGGQVRTVDLYGTVVSRWLHRDEGKHNLKVEHKLLLMEHLAAEMWRSGRSGWSVADIDRWLVRFIRSDADLEARYRHTAPELWEADLRTATFIVRKDDDTFAFAHTSLREYFVARYLVSALLLRESDATEALARWVMPVPSQETLDFLGQLLAALSEADRMVCLSGLRTMRSRYRRGASELAFAYGLYAYGAEHPVHALQGSVLDGAQLRNWRIASSAGRISLERASLRGADLRGAYFDNVAMVGTDLSSARLESAEFHHVDLRDASFAKASLIGTIFRGCRVPGLPAPDTNAYRTQLLNSQTRVLDDIDTRRWLVTSPPGLIPSRTSAPVDHALEVLAGHTGGVVSAGFSPDGSLVVSASTDGSVRLWDAASGELVRVLAGHTGGVRSAGFSPDGSLVVSAGDDGSVRLWDAASGELVRVLAGHAGWVRSAGFSPDGSLVVSASDDGSVRLWDATTGEQAGPEIRRLPGDEWLVLRRPGRTLVGATSGAWRWLGWLTTRDGVPWRLPAEIYGPLPPLRASSETIGPVEGGPTAGSVRSERAT